MEVEIVKYSQVRVSVVGGGEADDVDVDGDVDVTKPEQAELAELGLGMSQSVSLPREQATPPKEEPLVERSPEVDHDEKKNEHSNVPKLSMWGIFKVFWWFGCRAFGGPMSQIALMRTELIDEAKWITTERFNRVYAVYQILPGPEATELACYFGYLAGGRMGSLMGGLGFVSPGVSAMLLWSYLYSNYGISNTHVLASFRAVQIAVSAMIFRATFKLAEGALLEKPKKEFNWHKGVLCLFTFLTTTIGLNFFISLGVSGCMNALFESKFSLSSYIAYLSALCTIGFYILYVELNSIPSGSLIGSSTAVGSSSSFSSLFELGLIAGLVTFGGAYTTLPFIYSSAVVSGGWLTQKQFLDAVAITNMMPTPLVSFVSVVGFVGNGIGGALLMLLGIFIPAFSFTIIGHKFFEAFVNNGIVHPFLDGVSAAVIGLLLVTCFQFMGTVIGSDFTEGSNDGQDLGGIDAVVFSLAFWALFYFTDKFTQPIVIVAAAIAGQTLYDR
jgi:putative chromate ion transporter